MDLNSTHIVNGLSESLAEAIFEATDNGILIIDTNRKVLKYNSCFVEMWNIPLALQRLDQDEELLGFIINQLASPKQFIDKVAVLHNQPEAKSVDMTSLKNGRIFECFSRPIYLDGEIVARGWNFRDITETEIIRHDIANEIGFRKTILQTLPDPVWLKDPEGVYLACNCRFEDFFGASEAEIIGKTDYDFVNSEVADSFRQHDKKAMDKGSPYVNIEWITFANDGHRELVETTKTPMYNDTKELIGILGIAHNITKSDEKIRESAQILQNIVETTLDGFWTIDCQGNLIDVNSTYCQLSGYTYEELLTMHVSHLDAAESLLEIEERIKIISNQKHLQFETKHRRKDGSFWDVEVSITYLDIAGGRIFSFLRDITARKRVEETLKKNEKMLAINSQQAAMGEMISMIAHQWRQPLNIMSLAISNIQMKEVLNILSPPELEENFNIISSNISYMSNTIDDFRNYSRPDQEKELLVIESVLNSVFEMIGQSFKHNNITINVQNNSHRPLLLYKSKLIQILLNLLDNAKFALISNNVADAFISLNVYEMADTIRIAISDNGGGISKEAMDHLGEPYFTTKKLNGTGLGLHIAKTIIENYFGGELTWHNENQGACFLLTLKPD